MKVIKGISTFVFLSIAFSSCFNPPEFPNTPTIDFEDIYFNVTPELSLPDTLVLTIKFKDGDGDLGFDKSDPKYRSDPYNELFFYQENSPEKLKTNIAVDENNTQYEIVAIPSPGTGKLIFPRTRKNVNYDTLPEYNCLNYTYLAGRRLLVAESDIAVLDDLVQFTDTLHSANDRYFEILDTLYFTRNPNYYNITVDFLIKNNNGTFTPFDWACITPYDQRFPLLSETSDISLEGSLIYRMIGTGFNAFFSGKTLKLQIQIKDRALHQSNIIYTPEFTLDKIRR